ncbi:hypothetical protein CMQ_7768 [Grosmannia clavigera kw1407]|uniref:Uncharacterized protein n=1 Tax=Grosmannia clavigera (strain kw1407 / UAMH 11150) TaxID=655863 RepID=F0XRT8_GROCL|nr:uncharacterized protein CMQ_7768 [Grosmannia clavigera kw1407]EFW99400.1 hypothetical protein CMQ_7768 [Grosmannia clavigera kw1407]
MGERHAAYQDRGVIPSRNETEQYSLSRSTVSASASTRTHLRRNLFQSHLTRRPTTGASGMLPSTAASSNIYPNMDGGVVPDLGPQLSEKNDINEIIARDVNGDVQITDPPSPTPDEIKDPGFDERQENERENQRLADTIKYHQQRTSSTGQPEELLDAIRASLRAKVTALLEDNWIYEAKDMQRPE